MEHDKRIILFDGVCNLCNGFVRFILKHDKSNSLLFSPLQSDTGRRITGYGSITGGDTVVYSREGGLFYKSDAVLGILTDMGGVWSVFKIFRVIPRFLRDAVYDMVARSRYRVFGRRSECMIPGPDIKNRFLE